MSEGRNLSSAPFVYMENEFKKMGRFCNGLLYSHQRCLLEKSDFVVHSDAN